MKSGDGGQSYSTPSVLTSPNEISFNSVLGVDSSDDVYVGWTSLTMGQGRIMMSRSTDHGGSFSSAAAVTPSSQDADLARIALGPGGMVTCSYIDFSSGTPRLFFVRSTNGGVSFSAPSQISLSGEVVSTLGHSLVATPAGNIYIAYVDDSSVPVVRFASINGAALFTRSGPVTDPSLPSFAPELATDKNGAVYLVFYSVFQAGQPSETREIMFSRSCDQGGSFSQPLNLSASRTQSRFPSIVVDSSGGIYVTWESWANNNEQDIFFALSFSGGATFPNPPQNLSKTPGFSTHARLTAAAGTTVVAVWSDDSAAESDLFGRVVGASPYLPTSFGLYADFSKSMWQRGSRIQYPIYITRSGGFSDAVTVTPPDTSALKVIITPASLTASCLSVTFNVKVKKNAPAGPQILPFTGTDSKGNSVTELVYIVIQ